MDKNCCFDETVIFFDWDDTCFPSTFLTNKGFRLDSHPDTYAHFVEALRELETCVGEMLRLAMQCGTVVIVTNAERGWVELSSQKYVPGLVPILSQIHIISARSTFESTFPDSPLKWKFYAFQQNLLALFAMTDTRKNIISMGDSHVEREAIRAVARGSPNTVCKSVKFAERPSLGQLRRQIELVTNCFQYILDHDGDLDLQLTVTVNPETGEESDEEEDDEEMMEEEEQFAAPQEYTNHQPAPVPSPTF
jgi:hypothetical protein